MAKSLFLDALLAQALLILSLQLGIDLSALRGGVSVELGLEEEGVRVFSTMTKACSEVL